jgi:hypothetical protein
MYIQIINGHICEVCGTGIFNPISDEKSAEIAKANGFDSVAEFVQANAGKRLDADLKVK